jgi:2-aminoethylphosphonate-pyruvate transaminase
MNPGPVNVTGRVRRALLGPDICHREGEFSELLAGVRRKTLEIFGITGTHTAAFFTGSGTAAVEAMLAGFAPDRKKVLVLSNGIYGERMRDMLEIHGAPVGFLASGLGNFPTTAKIETLLKRDASIEGVAMVHHETSTGMLNPVSEVAALARKYEKTLLLDAVSSLGAEKLDFTKDRLGFVAGTSGKCLHGFPGISFVLVSKEEVRKPRAAKPRSLYLDLWNTLKVEEAGDTPFTPAVQLFYALDEALDELKKEGLVRRIREYGRKSSLLEKGFEELDLRFLIEKKYRSHVLTALWTPPGMSYEKLHDALKKAGFVIYAGQSRLKGRIFRVSNLGDIRTPDIVRFLRELKKTLARR